MTRRLAYVMVAVLLSAGVGCGFKQPADSVTTAISPSEKAADIAELTAASEIDVDPARMTLNGKEWSWIRTVYNNDTTIKPAKSDVFTLTFNNDNTMTVGTDCNRMNGSYSVDGRLLSIGK